MRSLGSIGSELCEMQRLRDCDAALRLKDAEWQRRIMQPPPPAATANPASAALPTPPAQLPPAFVRDARLFALSPPKPNLSASPPNVALNVASALPPPPPPPPPPSSSVAPPTLPLPVSQPLLFDAAAAAAAGTLSVVASQPLITPPLASSFSPLHQPLSPAAQSLLSTSTNAHSSDASVSRKPPVRAQKTRSHARGVGKIRRHRMTKEEEARFDPRDLVDLRGSTAAKSRKMSAHERDIMLHKRRLRNRQSAARSRDKQRKTISDVGEEVDQLLARTQRVSSRCRQVENELKTLRAAHDALRAENEQLKISNEQLKAANAQLVQQSPKMARTGSTLHVSLSTDMLDKIIGASADCTLPGGAADSSGMLRIPSKLHLSLSADKLADGVQASSCSQPSMARNLSIMERLFDLANNSNTANNISFDNILINTDTDVKKE